MRMQLLPAPAGESADRSAIESWDHQGLKRGANGCPVVFLAGLFARTLPQSGQDIDRPVLATCNPTPCLLILSLP